MNHIRLLAISPIAISLALGGYTVPAVYADTLEVNNSPNTFQYSPSVTVTVTSPFSKSFADGGAMNVTDQTTGTNILMYCVDVVDDIYIGTPTSGYTGTTLSSSTPVLGSYATSIEELFTTFLPWVNSIDTALGFQEALWGIIYPSYTISSGDTTANNNAAYYLNHLGSATNGYSLTVWSNSNTPPNQTLISFTPDTPNPAPEPLTWVLLVSGLGIVLLVERRRRARK